MGVSSRHRFSVWICFILIAFNQQLRSEHLPSFMMRSALEPKNDRRTATCPSRVAGDAAHHLILNGPHNMIFYYHAMYFQIHACTPHQLSSSWDGSQVWSILYLFAGEEFSSAASGPGGDWVERFVCVLIVPRSSRSVPMLNAIHASPLRSSMNKGGSTAWKELDAAMPPRPYILIRTETVVFPRSVQSQEPLQSWHSAR